MQEQAQGSDWLIAYRRTINAVADSRSVVVSILPRVGVGDSLFLISGLNAVDACILVALLNSFVFDYVARQRATGGNLSFYVMKQLPIVPPEALSRESRDFIIARVLELVVTANDMLPFARACGHLGQPFSWNVDRRFALRAELDAACARHFGVLREDLAYILDSFDVVRRRDEGEHGEFRSKRVILEIYDAMAEAARTGKPYQTRLDPPPADPRVAHPDTRIKG
jgi:hypothetical protein